MSRKTVLEIIRQASAELGLQQPLTAVSSADTTVIQMLGMLTALCDELKTLHAWTALQTEYTLTLTPGTDTYTLPADFDRIINSTEWNRSQRRPLYGPQSPQSWQQIKGWVIGNITYNYRIKANKLLLAPVPQTADTIALEYISAAFVIDGNTGSSKTAITLDTDLLVFDDRLLINGLKLKWKEAEGLNSAPAAYDYEQTYAAVKAADGGAPILGLGKLKGLNYNFNTPEGNWNR